MLIFVSSRPTYRQRFHFHRTAERIAQQHLPREFDTALKGALATAKK